MTDWLVGWMGPEVGYNRKKAKFKKGKKTDGNIYVYIYTYKCHCQILSKLDLNFLVVRVSIELVL